LFLPCSLHPRNLHSFPTRRSSDLDVPSPWKQFAFASENQIQDTSRTPLFADGVDALWWYGGWWEGPQETDLPAANLVFGNYPGGDRKSTRLNSSHLGISYAVFCLK